MRSVPVYLMLLLFVSLGLAAQPSPQRINYRSESTSFGELRVPPGAGPFPVAVLIHGGCWVATQSGFAEMRPMAEALEKHGIATWNIEYRRVGDIDGGWPGTFRDLADATDYLRVLAKTYPIDIARTVVVGHSSGGHFAAWLATRESLLPNSPLTGPSPIKLSGLVLLDAFLDPRVIDSRGVSGAFYCREPILARLLGGEPDSVSDRLQQIAPLAHLPWGVPQEYVVSSRRYPVIPARPLADERTTMQMPDYPALARAAGDRVEVEIVPDAEHLDFIKLGTKSWPAVEQAILRVVGLSAKAQPNNALDRTREK